MQADGSFCEHLQDSRCRILKIRCYRLNVGKHCEFQGYHRLLTKFSSEPSFTQIVKKTMLNEFLEEWKKYARKPRPGKKDIVGRPLEKSIRLVIKQELESFNAEVSTGRFQMWKNVSVIPDVVITKERCPTSIISIKSWIGTTQLRETFAKAYFSKAWHGHKNVRVYMMELQPIEARLNGLIAICKPYVDEVYSLSGKPYFDELVEVLKETYKD